MEEELVWMVKWSSAIAGTSIGKYVKVHRHDFDKWLCLEDACYMIFCGQLSLQGNSLSTNRKPTLWNFFLVMENKNSTKGSDIVLDSVLRQVALRDGLKERKKKLVDNDFSCAFCHV